jgi:excisionase family DNA binding protein
MEPLALTISQAAKLGGPCRSALYEDIRAGRLRAIKRGRSTRILVDDFRKYLALLPAIQPAGDINRPLRDDEIELQRQTRLEVSSSLQKGKLKELSTQVGGQPSNDDRNTHKRASARR